MNKGRRIKTTIRMISLFLVSWFTDLAIYGQTVPDRTKDSLATESGTPIVITFKADSALKSCSKTASGFYNVKKIDSFDTFYLIFIENDVNRGVICSEKKFSLVKREEIQENHKYYFELVSNRFINGIPLEPIPNVTYFGKYLGSELGKFYKATNLYGLIIP